MNRKRFSKGWWKLGHFLSGCES